MPGVQDPRLFDRLLAEGECEWIEFKTSWFDPGAIGRYASALANSARLSDCSAGYLLWGVSDSGEPVGTTLNPRTRVVQQTPFEFWLKARLSPKGHAISFATNERDGKPLALMTTAAADTVPVRFEGIPYVRIGSATPPLADHPDHERRLLAALAATTFEDDPAGEHVRDEEAVELLDVDGALERLGQRPGSTLDERLQQLERFRLIKSLGGGHWTITNLAAVMFARNLDAFGPSYGRKAARVIVYDGDSRVRTRFEQLGMKGYASGFEGMIDFIARQLPRNEKITGVVRSDQPLYPLIALREMVANALIHQDFSLRGAGPLIELFEGRLEISNPGVPLVEVDRLIDEPPRSRNERLARLMRHIGYCEERGSGIDKIIYAAEVFELPPPGFQVKEQGFVGTLYAPRRFAEMTSDERMRACYQHACLMWVSGGKAMTNATLRKRFGLAANRAAAISRLFGEALELGVIKPADPANQSRAQAAYLPYWA